MAMPEWWNEWWNSLTTLNQTFYAAAAFFSVFFLWQLIAAIVGLGSEEVDTADADVAGDVHHDFAAESAEAMDAFRLISIRSMISFLTLFTWGGALYLNWGMRRTTAIGYAVLWGLGGMVTVALILYGLRKLAQRGTSDLATCVGERGTVYLDIPEDGAGEVRVPVSGMLSHVRARCAGGRPLKAGVAVRVVRRLDQTTVEVEPVAENQ
jgi:hypothetical protein